MELPDGSHKLASVGGITGDLFTDAWGLETADWVNHFATVDIRYSKNSDTEYIVLVPADQEVTTSDRIAAERGEANRPMDPIINLPGEDEVNVADIPF